LTLHGKRKLRVVRRVWQVREINSARANTILQTWDHLEMAQAHRDGLMVHYAKYLLTREQV
jgi:hypothetical protein